MINTAAFWMSLASAVPFLMEHIGSVIMTFRGTLNVLWTVRPSRSRVAAKPLLAVAMAILPCDLCDASNVYIRKFLTQPPGASKK
ncbi:hypothetical protein PoB_005674300 [Plakobranchus ocellatus]|uniref:Uncharacterized protein n=1 Tax=Plakobranchus ocellatus TaxID=259542 RepID=A0AAV4CGT2_9GAST|nr:hypothetical protein PoB_005674300 [Plakobranchus ocellatus]